MPNDIREWCERCCIQQPDGTWLVQNLPSSLGVSVHRLPNEAAKNEFIRRELIVWRFGTPIRLFLDFWVPTLNLAILALYWPSIAIMDNIPPSYMLTIMAIYIIIGAISMIFNSCIYSFRTMWISRIDNSAGKTPEDWMSRMDRPDGPETTPLSPTLTPEDSAAWETFAASKRSILLRAGQWSAVILFALSLCVLAIGGFGACVDWGGLVGFPRSSPDLGIACSMMRSTPLRLLAMLLLLIPLSAAHLYSLVMEAATGRRVTIGQLFRGRNSRRPPDPRDATIG